MNTEQDNKYLEIGRLHLVLSKCAALELESASIVEVQITYVDEDGDDARSSVEIKTDDRAQREILDALIRYKHRLQFKLSDLEISLTLPKLKQMKDKNNN